MGQCLSLHVTCDNVFLFSPADQRLPALHEVINRLPKIHWLNLRYETWSQLSLSNGSQVFFIEAKLRLVFAVEVDIILRFLKPAALDSSAP